MIGITVRIEGAPNVERALAAFKGSLAEKLEAFLKREGAEMERELKQTLSIGAAMSTTDRKGKAIRVTGPRGGKRWEPSRPGEPPRLRTGNLRAAQGFRVSVNKGSGGFVLDVGGIRGGGAEVKYQQELELGRSNMAPRPHLMPVVMKHLATWPKGLKVLVDDAGKGGAK